MSIKVRCACGRRLKARSAKVLAGKRGRCPGCGEPMVFSPRFLSALKKAKARRQARSETEKWSNGETGNKEIPIAVSPLRRFPDSLPVAEIAPEPTLLPPPAWSRPRVSCRALAAACAVMLVVVGGLTVLACQERHADDTNSAVAQSELERLPPPAQEQESGPRVATGPLLSQAGVLALSEDSLRLPAITATELAADPVVAELEQVLTAFQPPAPVETVAATTIERGPARNAHGTSLAFAANPTEAGQLALKNKKMVFLLHLSGNFEDDCFT